MALNNEYIGYKTKVSSEEISKDGVLSYLSAIGSTNNYYSDNNVAPHMFNVVQEIGLVESIWKMEDLYESKEEMDILTNPETYNQSPDIAWKRLRYQDKRPHIMGVIIELAK